MSCSQCCGIENVFDEKEARKKLRQYRKKGGDKATRKLIDLIRRNQRDAKSLLDVGGGVGAIQLELFKSGIESTTSVDASPAYVKVADEEAVKQGVANRIERVSGDFAEIGGDLKKHDITTMDKVICCYPDAVKLLENAGDRSGMMIGLVYPPDHWLTRLVSRIGNFFIRFMYRDFKSYVHSEKLIHQVLEAKGFQESVRERSGIWRVVLWEKA